MEAEYARIIRETVAYAEDYKEKGFTFIWDDSLEFSWESGAGWMGTPRVKYEGIDGTIEMLQYHIDKIVKTSTDSENGSILLRLCSFFRLCVFGGVPYAAAKRILKRDKRTEDEKKVMHLANQTILSTAEIIKCFQRKKLDFCCEEELLDELYGDDVTTSDNMAFMVQYLPECRPVILSVANLYLRRQIIFERI